MKIVLTDCETISDNHSDFEIFCQYGDVVLYDTSTPLEAAERVAEADMVICNKTIIGREAMDNAPGLKYIGLFATGYNNIDIEYAAHRGITVCNAGSYSTNAVAQHTFALILEYYSRTAAYASFTADGGWKGCRVFSPVLFETHELAGKTLGIVGLGNIGTAVSRIGLAFGMKVIAFTRTEKRVEGVELVSFDELLERSDIISVHCPLNSGSEKLFGAAEFARCKDNALFVNTARGGIVDEQALRNALDGEILGGAAIDTISTEPMREDCPLFGAKNIIITPHIAWAARETIQRLIGIVSTNIRAYLEGKPVNLIV